MRLLRTVTAGTPSVLVIEDAHWLDSASTGLVLALSRERMPLLLVVATRSRGEGGTLADELAWAPTGGCCGRPRSSGWCWTGCPRTRSGPWSASAGRGPRSRGPGRLVESKAEGNPLFTEELTFAPCATPAWSG